MNIFKAGRCRSRGEDREKGTIWRSEERAQRSGLDLFHIEYLECEKKESEEEKLQLIFKENVCFGKYWVKSSVSKKRKTYSVFVWRIQMLPVCLTSKC